MNNIKKPNCYARQVKVAVESRLLNNVESWAEKWFVKARISPLWHWNRTLFGCASSLAISNQAESNDWLQAASHALSGDSQQVLVSSYIEQIKTAMQQDLNAIFDFAEGQLAAIIELTINDAYTILIELPQSYFNERSQQVDSLQTISKPLLDAISGQQVVRLHSEIKSYPIPLRQLLNLQVGDQLLLDHASKNSIDISIKNIPLVKGYLVSNQGQRSVVLTNT